MWLLCSLQRCTKSSYPLGFSYIYLLKSCLKHLPSRANSINHWIIWIFFTLNLHIFNDVGYEEEQNRPLQHHNLHETASPNSPPCPPVKCSCSPGLMRACFMMKNRMKGEWRALFQRKLCCQRGCSSTHCSRVRSSVFSRFKPSSSRWALTPREETIAWNPPVWMKSHHSLQRSNHACFV